MQGGGRVKVSRIRVVWQDPEILSQIWTGGGLDFLSSLVSVHDLLVGLILCLSECW